MIPAGELQACLFSAVDPGAIDRLTARLSSGSDSYVRELELFPTDQEAVSYIGQLQALYEALPDRRPERCAADLHDRGQPGRDR